ncbi:MAG: ADP-ribosylglycohydrolase family protein [bacterium]
MPNITILNRYRGCLIGGAIGDTILLRSPHMSATKWNSNTALTMGTVNSILNVKDIKDRGLDPQRVARHLLKSFDDKMHTDLTTRAAINNLSQPNDCPESWWSRSGVDKPWAEEAGNGAAARISPIALFSYGNVKHLRQNVSFIAQITHKNQESINGALAVAFMIASIINGRFDRNEILDQTIDYIDPSKMADKIAQVKELLQDPDLETQKALEMIGITNSAFDTVGSSFYIFLKHIQTFESPIIMALTHNKGNRAIPSIVGNISGAYHGDKGIFPQWKDAVIFGKDILSSADKLYYFCHGIE